MDRRAWVNGGLLNSDKLTHSSGRYRAQFQGAECSLFLKVRPDGQISGELIADGETLELVGGISGFSSQGYGFMLEPETRSVIAIFRMALEEESFTLELDVPDFSERLTLSHTEKVAFQRVPSLEETLILSPSKESK